MSSLAVLYLLLGAEFLAIAQIIVYAGAIMVLFTFVVMLLNAGREERTLGSRAGRICNSTRSGTTAIRRISIVNSARTCVDGSVDQPLAIWTARSIRRC